MQETNDIAHQNRQLIAEAERLRIRLQQALEELEEIREEAERQRRNSSRRRIAADFGSLQFEPIRDHEW